MIRLIKLHFGVCKFFVKSFPKIRKREDIFKFFKVLKYAYVKSLKFEINYLYRFFDKNYYKIRKRNKKKKELIKQLKNILKLLEIIDKRLFRDGKNRELRRQFWRNFIKHGEVRKEIFVKLLDEIERG